jgi:hypothetical protein
MSKLKIKTPKPKKFSNEDLVPLFLASLGGRLTILGVDYERWHLYPKEPPPPVIPAFLAKHHDRLRALMDKPGVLLGLDWNDGDGDVLVTVVSATQRGKFETFRLPF